MKKLIIFLILICYNNFAFAQIDVVWSKTIEIENYESSGTSQIITDNDNNLYVLAGMRNDNTSQWNVFLAKYNSNGDELWNTIINDRVQKNIILYNNSIYLTCAGSNKIYFQQYSLEGNLLNEIETFSIPSDYWVSNLTLLIKDNYIYLSVTTEDGWYIPYSKLYKMDLTGNVIWSYNYPLTRQSGIKFDLDYNLILYGQKNVFFYNSKIEFETESDAFIKKINLNGNLIWDYTINHSNESHEVFRYVAFDSSNNYYAIYADHYTGNFPIPEIKKINTSGVEEWSTTFEHPVSGFDNFYEDIYIRNSNIILVGKSYISSNQPNILTVSYNLGGNLQWHNNYYTEVDYSGHRTTSTIDNSDTIFSAGYMYDGINQDRNDLFIKVLSSTGMSLYDFSYNTTGNSKDYIKQITAKSNNIYLIGECDDNLLLMKLSNPYANSVEDFSKEQIKIYPNPTDGNITISIPNSNFLTDLRLEIRDALGKNIPFDRIDNTIIIDKKARAGVYFLQIYLNNQITNKKIIIN